MLNYLHTLWELMLNLCILRFFGIKVDEVGMWRSLLVR